jgi:hypothetical protein
LNSGALITAAQALAGALGAAVPGHINAPSAMRIEPPYSTRAKLVMDASDILDDLQILRRQGGSSTGGRAGTAPPLRRGTPGL